jgi:hypothetical protein
VAHAVEHREDGGPGSDRGREVGHRRIERVRLHGEQDQIVRPARVASGQRGAGPQVGVAVQALDAQAVVRDLLGAPEADEERHVAPGL